MFLTIRREPHLGTSDRLAANKLDSVLYQWREKGSKKGINPEHVSHQGGNQNRYFRHENCG